MNTRSAAFGGLAAGGVLGVVASARPWWRASTDGATVTFTGAGATGGLSQALPVAVLAGALLALVLRSGGRRAVAVLLGLAAVGMVGLGLLRRPPDESVVRGAVRQVSLTEQFQLVGTGWPYAEAAAGLLALAAATTMLLRAGRWPGRPERFRRGGVVPDSDEPVELWRAMDAGLDPTVDPGVRDRTEGDTMGTSQQGRRQQPEQPSRSPE